MGKSVPATIDADTKVKVARKLGHAVVLTSPNENALEMYALPLVDPRHEV